MAQRTIHMLFAVLLADKLEVRDKNRFYLGSILTDAYGDPGDRKKVHFMKHTPDDDNGRFFAFNDFYNTYKEQIMSDDLYLGYYAHLVEDAFYRYFIYYEKDFMAKIAKEELTYLHRDYSILNAYIAEKYPMPRDLTAPENFDGEEISRLAGFDVPKMIADYNNDLAMVVDEKTKYLTEDMLEEFVSEYRGVLEAELKAAREGRPGLNPLEYKWLNK